LIRDLTYFAAKIRLETVRQIGTRGFGHLAGSLSVADALAVLYGSVMRVDPHNPDWPERDKLVMSKGHAGPALYATLSLRGFFPEETLKELNQGGGSLPSHCDMHKTIGVDMTTGSLGQGMSTAIGIALGARLSCVDCFTFLVLGDGECNEGQVWEGALFAAHNKLGGLIAFVDWNKQQLDGYTKDIIDMGDIGGKFEAFGWHTQVIDGHDPDIIKAAITNAKGVPDAPSMIVLDTVKGHGCYFAEGIEANHHINFTQEQIGKALQTQKEKLEAARAGANKE